MKSLKSLEKLITQIANSEQLMSKVKEIFPIYEFKLTKEAYVEFAQKLRDSGNYDLVKYVFDESNTYNPGHRADWNTIQQLIRQYGNTNTDITTDTEIQAVYARLAASALALESNTKRLGAKLQVKKEYIYELLSNTEAFKNITLNYAVSTKQNITETTAKYTVDLKANIQTGNRVLAAISDKIESLALDKMSLAIKSAFSSIDLEDVTRNFLDTITSEFTGKKIARQKISELNNFNTKSKAVITSTTKQAIEEVGSAVKSLEKEIRSEVSKAKSKKKKPKEELRDAPSAANLWALLNRTIYEEVVKEMAPKTPGRLTFGGGYGKSYFSPPIGRFAHSVRIANVYKAPKATDLYYIKYDYLRNPYATFAPGGKQYKFNRKDVQRIIRQAITKIARTLITERLNITPI